MTNFIFKLRLEWLIVMFLKYFGLIYLKYMFHCINEITYTIVIVSQKIYAYSMYATYKLYF